MAVMWQDICVKAGPYLVMVTMGISLFLLLYRYFWKAPAAIPQEITHQKSVLAQVVIWFCASRLLILLCVGITAACQGRFFDVLRSPENWWLRWDAPHYVGLADNGYTTVGDARYHIVFYPLYPTLVWCAKWLFAGKTALAACIVSNLCLLGAGWALAEAVRLRQGRESGLAAMRLLMLSPYGVFFSVAYTESLFLLLCALAVLMARREKFGWAILFGALAANTRMPGVLTAIPIFYEMLARGRREAKPPSYFMKSVAQVCLVLLGVGAYLALNYAVWGNPLQFMVYQREHWDQRLGWVWDTFQYTVKNALSYHDEVWRIYTWVPQAVAMLLSFLLLAFSAPRRAYPADGAFMWVYMAIALGVTWLLSGPRYLCGMYALYPILAATFRKKWCHWALCAGFAALLGYLSCVYVLAGNLL